MTIDRPWLKAIVYAFAAMAMCLTGTSIAQAQPDSLVLHQPENLTVWRDWDSGKKLFRVFMTWDDVPAGMRTFTHDPDTLGWDTGTLPLSIPQSQGTYNGDIDRTVVFVVSIGGEVGVDQQVEIRYEVRKEEHLNNRMDIGAGYTPGTFVPAIFRDALNGGTVDLGIEIAFSPGRVGAGGQFLLGMEDFEGFHLWRGINPDGSDLEIIGELSKEEANIGRVTGGNITDSVYFHVAIPELRQNGIFFSGDPIDCIGNQINVQLANNEYLWFDCNAFNGFTYYYGVTTFDRGYGVTSGRQGLNKIESCQPKPPAPFPCQSDLVSLEMVVDNQPDLNEIYAVPNPYRSGGSRLTTENYHNFPDNMMRFVNVPPECELRIYTVAGGLVTTINHSGGGNIVWNTQNDGGQEVTSGIYIYRVKDASGTTVFGRLAIIR